MEFADRRSKFPAFFEGSMRHFDHQNRHEIKDANGGLWATFLFTDFETFAELSRHGFFVVDMSSELWATRRDG